MRTQQFALATALCGALSCIAAPPFSSSTSTSDAELSTLRGGVLLPNGLDVDVGIDIQTRVNGVLALRTVVSTAAPIADRVRVFTGGSQPSAPAGTPINWNTPSTPTLIIDRNGAGTTLNVGTGTSGGTHLAVVNAPVNTWPQYPEESRLDIDPNGPPTPTQGGAVSVERSGSNTEVSLVGNGLTIRHLVGNATGIVVTNTANNLSVDSLTTIDVDVHGTWPAITTAMFNVGSLAVDAASRR